MSFVDRQTPHPKAKLLNVLAWVVSFVILAVVGILFKVKIDLPFDPYVLPKINAAINALTAFVLIGALWAIKQKNMKLHSNLIYVAMGLSVAFLVGYIMYHMGSESTRFGGEGTIKYIYLIILLTHIVLAAVMPFFVLFTFVKGFTGQYAKHRKLAKIAFPIWLYVSITGVICYLMIAPYYPS